MRDKIKLALYKINKGTLYPVENKADSKVNSLELPKELSKQLGVNETYAMAITGYLLDLKYIDFDLKKGFSLTTDIDKRTEIDTLLSGMTDAEAEEIKKRSLP